jgi:hypothetical protein
MLMAWRRIYSILLFATAEDLGYFECTKKKLLKPNGKYMSQLWDFKFSRQRAWCSELSSGMYWRVIWLSTDVSEVLTASIIRDVGRQSFHMSVHPRRQFWTYVPVILTFCIAVSFIYVFWMVLNVNSDYLLKHRYTVDHFSGEVWCSVWGTDWILKCYVDELQLQRVYFPF